MVILSSRNLTWLCCLFRESHNLVGSRMLQIILTIKYRFQSSCIRVWLVISVFSFESAIKCKLEICFLSTRNVKLNVWTLRIVMILYIITVTGSGYLFEFEINEWLYLKLFVGSVIYNVKGNIAVTEEWFTPSTHMEVEYRYSNFIK